MRSSRVGSRLPVSAAFVLAVSLAPAPALARDLYRSLVTVGPDTIVQTANRTGIRSYDAINLDLAFWSEGPTTP